MLSYTSKWILEEFYKSLQASDYRLDPTDYHMEGFVGIEGKNQEWIHMTREEVEEFLKDCVEEGIEVETDFKKLFVARGGVLGSYYFNGQLYSGKGVYINGYNGYESSEDDGVLCALIPDKTGVPSCWDKDTGEPNHITDRNGCLIRDTKKRGLKCEFTEGVEIEHYYDTD